MTNIELYLKTFRIKTPDYVDQVVLTYLAVFPEYVVMNRGKEREAAGKLARYYRLKYPDGKTEDALMAFRQYFVSCKNINDNWLRNNMSLPIIMSKFNQINKIIKNGGHKESRTTDAQLAEIVSKHFASDKQ